MVECEHEGDPATCPACNTKPRTSKTPKPDPSGQPKFRHSNLPTGSNEWQHESCDPGGPSDDAIEAKYHGTCVTCLGRIEPSDPITRF